jgi:hypothetical protein
MATIISQQSDWATVRGKSLIDHQIRCKLGLTMIEYAVMDMIYSFHIDKKPIHIDDMKRELGMNQDHWMKVIHALIGKDMLTGPNGQAVPANAWLKEFYNDVDFDEFWTIFMKHGNKASAKKNYQLVRKLIDREYLLKRAKTYIKGVLDVRKDIEFAKAAEVWLNPKKKHWEDLAPGETKNIVQQKTEGTFQGNIYGKKK